jgi:heptose-I-phosphate ethanolaminephosphotransferase
MNKYTEFACSKFTPQMSHIPLILVLSPAYQQQNPALYRTLTQQRQNYWTNDLVYNLLVELMGIQDLHLIELQFTLGSPAYDRNQVNLRNLHGERKLE